MEAVSRRKGEGVECKEMERDRGEAGTRRTLDTLLNSQSSTVWFCCHCLPSSPEATRSEKGRAVTAETQFSDMHVPTPLEAGSWGRYCTGFFLARLHRATDLQGGKGREW